MFQFHINVVQSLSYDSVDWNLIPVSAVNYWRGILQVSLPPQASISSSANWLHQSSKKEKFSNSN